MKKEFSTNDHIHPDNGKNPHNQDSPQNGTWNDHQLEQLFGEALGDIPTADETRKAWQTFIRRHRIRHQSIRRITIPGIAAAVIALVDSNLHREKILPSEKAYAYKLKKDALSRQGQRTDLTSTQDVSKFRTNELVGEANGDSRETVRRYIRLTHLLPELLQKVDEGQIAFTPAVHLSHLSPTEQGWVLDEMERNDCTPSVGQAYHLKERSLAGTLTRDYAAGLMSQEKANQKERLKIPMERIRKYFPKYYTTAQMEEEIVRMCEARFRRRSDRDER